MGINQRSELVNLLLFDITANNGKKIQLSDGVTELHLYESILDNTVRCTAIVADTGNRAGGNEGSASILEKADGLLTAGEKVELVVEDNNGQPLKFVDNYHLRVKEVHSIVEDTRKLFFTIDLYSKECIDNHDVNTRVTKRYDGKISDSVYKILKNDCIKTPKTVDVDPILNTLNFLGQVQKPFHLLPWLAKRSVPDLPNSFGNLAGYFFYEIADNGTNSGGFKFKSIDKLFQQTPKGTLIFNNTPSLPVDYDAKILSYTFSNTIDLEKSLLTGSHSATNLKTFDPYTHNYTEETFNAFNQLKEATTGGVEPIQIGADLKLNEKTTRTFVKTYDTGGIPSGATATEQLKMSKRPNFDMDKILRQSSMRYNNLFTTKVTIAIDADFTLHVGDLIHCDFPEVSAKNLQEVSYRKSGLYMIVDLCHFIRFKPKQAFTRLHLVRDSIGRKPF